VKLLEFVECIEEALGIRAMPLPSGDVVNTWADTRELVDRVGFRPQITVSSGVQSSVDWYRNYYSV